MKLTTMRIVGALIAVLLPGVATAQTGKHVAIGASVGTHDYADHRFHQGVGVQLLYRVAPTGAEENGLSFGPSATLG